MEPISGGESNPDQRLGQRSSISELIVGLQLQHPELSETFSIDGPFRPLVLQWRAEELEYETLKFESENQALLQKRGLISPMDLIKRSIARRRLGKLKAKHEKFLEKHFHEMDPWPIGDISDWEALS